MNLAIRDHVELKVSQSVPVCGEVNVLNISLCFPTLRTAIKEMGYRVGKRLTARVVSYPETALVGSRGSAVSWMMEVETVAQLEWAFMRMVAQAGEARRRVSACYIGAYLPAKNKA